MLACVTSFAASLLYLAPVLMMVGFVVYAKVRGRGYDPEAEVEAAPMFDFERPEGTKLERVLEPVT